MLVGEAGQIEADLREDQLRCRATQAVDARQVDARGAPERGAGRLVAPGADGLLFGRSRVGRDGLRAPLGRGEVRQPAGELGVVRGQEGVEVIEQP